MKQAAHELALTPGAVSQRIRQLEEAAGRRLFTRTSTGVELSVAGDVRRAGRAFSGYRGRRYGTWFTIVPSRDGEYGALTRGDLAGARGWRCSGGFIQTLKLPWRRAPARSI
jgi:hypothetical protein